MNADHFFYSIDQKQNSISVCDNDLSEIADLLEKTKRAKQEFAHLEWKNSALFNNSDKSVEACALISRKAGESQFHCLKFNAQSFSSEEKIYTLFDSEKKCWDDRDLTYVSKIDSLYDEESLAYLVHRFQNLFKI